MSSFGVDLARYLRRIGCDDLCAAHESGRMPPPSPDLLSRIQFAHACAVPFENLDVLRTPARGVALDLPSIEQKIIGQRRGGYCFEQNALLLAVLKAMGFDAAPLSARVRVSMTRDQTPPRTHLFVRVMLGGEAYLADVGVGGFSPTAPLRMETSETQTTPHDQRRIIPGEGPHAGLWFHQVLVDAQWLDVYDFTGEEMPDIDREVSNWWTSTHPESKFRRSIMAAIARPDGSRVTLLNRAVTYRRSDAGRAQIPEARTLQRFEELTAILRSEFALELPEESVAEARRVFDASPT